MVFLQKYHPSGSSEDIDRPLIAEYSYLLSSNPKKVVRAYDTFHLWMFL